MLTHTAPAPAPHTPITRDVTPSLWFVSFDPCLSTQGIKEYSHTRRFSFHWDSRVKTWSRTLVFIRAALTLLTVLTALTVLTVITVLTMSGRLTVTRISELAYTRGYSFSLFLSLSSSFSPSCFIFHLFSLYWLCCVWLKYYIHCIHTGFIYDQVCMTSWSIVNSNALKVMTDS